MALSLVDCRDIEGIVKATQERESVDGRHIPEGLVRKYNEMRATHFFRALQEDTMRQRGRARAFVMTRLDAKSRGNGLYELTGEALPPGDLDEAQYQGEIDRICGDTSGEFHIFSEDERREYKFCLPNRAGDASPKLLVVVGGMGQGKSGAQEAHPSFSQGMGGSGRRLELGMDALKAACVTMAQEMATVEEDETIDDDERKRRLNQIKKLYQDKKMTKGDQGAIVHRAMEMKMDIVTEFANEDNLYDMAVGISDVFPSLGYMSQQGYQLRLIGVQCMDKAENIIVGTNSRRDHLGNLGIGMQKWIVSKGTLIRAAFFLDSLKHIFRAEEAGGFSLVEMAMMVTREKWDSKDSTVTSIDREALLGSKYVADAKGRLTPGPAMKGNTGRAYPGPYDGDVIPSAEWQNKKDELMTVFDPFNSDSQDTKQVEFTSKLRARWGAYCASTEVMRLLGQESAAQEFIRCGRWGKLTELRALFDKLDKNGNGTVDKKEWGRALSANREAMAKFFGGETMAEIGKQFKRIDVDKSGDLSWEEVMSAVKVTGGSGQAENVGEQQAATAIQSKQRQKKAKAAVGEKRAQKNAATAIQSKQRQKTAKAAVGEKKAQKNAATAIQSKQRQKRAKVAVEAKKQEQKSEESVDTAAG